MKDKFDAGLRARFERWREFERTEAPAFERIWQQALRRARNSPRIWPHLRFASTGVAALAVIAAGWLTWNNPAGGRTERGRRAWERVLKPVEEEPVSVDTSAGSTPTDFLLERQREDAAESDLKR